MVTSSNSLVIHEDTLHTGSAKRGQASGVAELDAGGKVPAGEMPAVELLSNKNAASGYPGLDASSLIALTQQRLNLKIGTTVKNTADASGAQNITGVGFAPRLVIIVISNATANPRENSIGVSDGTTQWVDFDNNNATANTRGQTSGQCIKLIQTGAIFTDGSITTLGADGFTIDWTKTGAKTGTAMFSYIAIR